MIEDQYVPRTIKSSHSDMCLSREPQVITLRCKNQSNFPLVNLWIKHECLTNRAHLSNKSFTQKLKEGYTLIQEQWPISELHFPLQYLRLNFGKDYWTIKFQCQGPDFEIYNFLTFDEKNLFHRVDIEKGIKCIIFQIQQRVGTFSSIISREERFIVKIYSSFNDHYDGGYEKIGQIDMKYISIPDLKQNFDSFCKEVRIFEDLINIQSTFADVYSPNFLNQNGDTKFVFINTDTKKQFEEKYQKQRKLLSHMQKLWRTVSTTFKSSEQKPIQINLLQNEEFGKSATNYLNNCGFIASAKALFEKNERLIMRICQSNIISKTQQEIFSISLFIDGSRKPMLVDRSILCRIIGDKPERLEQVGVTGNADLRIIEKAFLRLFYNIFFIMAGCPIRESLYLLTGFWSERHRLLNQDERQESFGIINHFWNSKQLSLIVLFQILQLANDQMHKNVGLEVCHTYFLVNIVELKNRQILYILRDPMNNTSWSGDWHRKCKKWQLNGYNSLQSKIYSNSRCDTFAISKQDIIKYFTAVITCKIYDNWETRRHQFFTNINQQRIFYFRVNKPGKYIILAEQNNKRYRVEYEKYLKKDKKYELTTNKPVLYSSKELKIYHCNSEGASNKIACEQQSTALIVSTKINDFSRGIYKIQLFSHYKLNEINLSQKNYLSLTLISNGSIPAPLFENLGELKQYQKSFRFDFSIIINNLRNKPYLVKMKVDEKVNEFILSIKDSDKYSMEKRQHQLDFQLSYLPFSNIIENQQDEGQMKTSQTVTTIKPYVLNDLLPGQYSFKFLSYVDISQNLRFSQKRKDTIKINATFEDADYQNEKIKVWAVNPSQQLPQFPLPSPKQMYQSAQNEEIYEYHL